MKFLCGDWWRASRWVEAENIQPIDMYQLLADMIVLMLVAI